MNEKLQTVGVRLPLKCVKQLRAIAEYQEWTLSQTARKLIEQALVRDAKLGRNTKPGPKGNGR